MKAVLQDRYGTSATLRIADVDTPVPTAGQVLLQVSAASIHIGDWHLMTGLPLLARLALGIRAPKQRVRGMDVAGRITAVGANVTSHLVGDYVFGTANGAFAEFAVAQADAVVPLPAETTAERAAALPTSATTALHAVRDAGKVQAGQRVLVLGAAGGVGIFAVQIAKALRAHVTGVCSEPKRDLVRSLGADQVLDYRVDRVIGSERYDVIVDMGGRRPVRQLRRALTPTGTLVIVGGEGGGRVLGGFERSLLAPLAGLFSKQKFRGLISVTKEADLLDLKAMVEAGTLRPIIDSTFALSDTPAAMHRLEEHLAVGKLVIAVHPD
ncbi:Mycocerosic acid synthase [Arthrobacter ulcerisalmonis]|uniref:Mycocerosic acid synthase n=1 Tax=Arthrobacter ulcerisalmonis TaxID=2483813 RepID=A0A3P5WIQ5_9MICC|nr:NAD(P)-dependent alcohol dehydrogenase [Arthrobacter ulcerisalmonis]VDC18442.1 Mycocerosic acid synthase [Arthrobacter ulcerisalmonis]